MPTKIKNELLELWEEAYGITWEEWKKRSMRAEIFTPLDRFEQSVKQIKESGISQKNFFDSSPMSTYHDHRRHLYAWAVPTPEIIKYIAKFSPIVEIGAGTGYWAALLRQEGAKVYAYDKNPPKGDTKNHWAQNAWAYTHVAKGTEINSATHTDCTLFLCWPPMGEMAFQSLRHYKGERVIYIGEWRGGATADDDFFDALDKDWTEINTLRIPQWLGLYDYLVTYERA